MFYNLLNTKLHGLGDMGKWVNVFFNNEEYKRLQVAVIKESRKHGRRLSPYEVVKGWVMEKLKEYEENGET